MRPSSSSEKRGPVDDAWLAMIRDGKFGDRRVVYFQETDSTNKRAFALGRQGEAGGTVVVAEGQTAGKGRMNRLWLSPPGEGLYFSLISRPRILIADAPKISLAAALALCLAIEETCGIQPKVKWPNDLLLDGRKCCGILSELETGEPGERGVMVILGIGVNVSTHPSTFPEEIRHRVTSLGAFSGKHLKRSTLLAASLMRLDAVIHLLEEGRFSSILDQWKQRDALAGLRLSWLTPAGNVVAGISLGPDDDGILRIQDDRGKVHEVVSGDIHTKIITNPP